MHPWGGRSSASFGLSPHLPQHPGHADTTEPPSASSCCRGDTNCTPGPPPGHAKGYPSAPYMGTEGDTRLPMGPTAPYPSTRGDTGPPTGPTSPYPSPSTTRGGTAGGEPSGGPSTTPRRAQGGAAAARLRRTARAADTFACARCNVRSSNFLPTYVQPSHSCF